MPHSHANYINRELSWIEFNHRVLQEAKDETHPPLERAKFLAIFATNLDEFFMIRVSGLREQVIAGVTDLSPDGLTPGQILELINLAVTPLQAEHVRTWQHEVKPLLVPPLLPLPSQQHQLQLPELALQEQQQREPL